MAILSKGTDFENGDTVTSSKLEALVENAAFVAGSSGTTDNASLEVNSLGRLQVKDGGITSGKIAASAVSTAKLPNSTSQTDGVTLAKIQQLSNLRVIGNASGAVAAPSQLTVYDEDNMASDSATGLATQKSIKAYVDGSLTVPKGATIETSGSFTMGNGLIVKFGQYILSNSNPATITFPTPFPNNHFLTIVNLNTGNANRSVSSSDFTLTGFVSDRQDDINGTSTQNFISIGN